MKQCKACKQDKPSKYFYPDHRAADNKSAECKDCIKARVIQNYERKKKEREAERELYYH